MVPCIRKNAIRHQWPAGSSPASVGGLDMLA